MPNYVGYSLEFAKNNLKSLGISEDKIEVKEVDTVQERISEGEVAKQIPAPYEKLDINNPIVKLYIYKPKTTTTTNPTISNPNRGETSPQNREQQSNQTTSNQSGGH